MDNGFSEFMIMLLFILLLGSCMSNANKINKFKREAIDRGFAHIKHDKYGNGKGFEWLPLTCTNCVKEVEKEK